MIKKKAKTYYAKLHISENKYFLFFKINFIFYKT